FRYATGLITRKYAKGQEISVKIRITANHQGWFEFRVGDIGTPPITQAKFTYLLKTPDGKTRVPLRGYGSSLETIKLRLPADLTCRQCVLQWWWKVGNSWGCEMVNGKKKCGLGYGPQETFVNCADIQIGDGGGLPPPTPTGVPPPPPPPAQEPPQPPPPTNLPYPYGCKATKPWTGMPSIDICNAEEINLKLAKESTLQQLQANDKERKIGAVISNGGMQKRQCPKKC
ncbi:uncharacterized protein LOC110252082, partial [Exaiptasia diaphana]|uniref:Chitin-binding type-4 domain-containing protein n=1 Tax=Exaiptasia diaphana TaxID=2652724 RepID=A0A913Y5M0_EXADI